MKEINEPKIELRWNRPVQVEFELRELAVLFAILGRASTATIRSQVDYAFRSNPAGDSDTLLPDNLYADMKSLLTKYGVEFK